MDPLKRTKVSKNIFTTGPAYWIRFGLGIAAGLICGILALGIDGVTVGMAVYMASFLLLPFVYHIPLTAEGQGRTYYTVGLGTYIAVWFTLWILISTLRAY